MPPDAFPPDDASRHPGDANVVDPAVMAERRAQRAELSEQVAVRRAADAQALAAELSAERARLEAELEQARREPERLSRLVAERERALRAAQQRAHGEEAQRLEAAEELSTSARRHEAELADLRARAERAEEQRALLAERAERAEGDAESRGAELEALRTRLTEAEQIAAAAERALRRAEAKRAASREKRRRAIEAREAAEAELAAAQGEARAAREGADAVMAEAAHVESERETLRAELAQARAERDALRTELAQAREERDGGRAELAGARAERDGLRTELAQERDAAASAAAAPARFVPSPSLLRSEFMLARATRGRPVRTVPPRVGVTVPTDALARERRLVEERGAASALAGRGSGAAAGAARAAGLAAAVAARAAGPAAVGDAALRGAEAERRVPPRAIPVTALALERERSVRLQSQLDRQAQTERELRDQVEALERAVASRMDAEQRIEAALRRVRGELEAANALRMLTERGSPTRPLTSTQPAREATPTSPAPPASAAPPAPDAADAPPAPAPPAAAPPAPAPDPAAPPAADPDAAAPHAPVPAADPAAPPAAAAAAPGDPVPLGAGFDADRLNAARARLRAMAEAEERAAAGGDPAPLDASARPDAAAPADAAASVDPAPPADAASAGSAAPARTARPGPARVIGPARVTVPTPRAFVDANARRPVRSTSPWLPAALRRLVREDPETAGRILVGMLPAHGLVTQRPLAYDLVLADRGTVAVDVRSYGRTTVRALDGPRESRRVDFRVAASHAGFARLLLTRRGLRRRARVRGSRRRLRELRRLSREPLALRDLASTGATLEPALALWLAALAIQPADTVGHRFTIAHAPLPGGPADAWLRIQDGAPPSVLRTPPGEPVAATLRCTRGALIALLAGVAPPAGEGAAIDGDAAVLELVRGWIRATEFPAG
ncbi:hypothetical protein [Conexibacter woesei]|nr:hypothetical protein [Conexibacter woesei]